MREATLTVHGPDCHETVGPVMTPIYLSSTYSWESFEAPPRWVYSRAENPNRFELESVVASLEGAKYAVATGSGMASISTAIELAQSGDHILIAWDIYGGTYSLARNILPRHGIEVTFFDSQSPEQIGELSKPNTKLVVFETPTNPTLQICDIEAIVAECKSRGFKTVFDNTFATPVLQKPFSFGVDVVCHSTTKYLGGHSDVVGGIAVTNDSEIHDLLFSAAVNNGCVPGPFDCWLVNRGIKTLVPRMKAHCENALRVAQFLDGHKKVAKVNYPGLPSHPRHELAKRQMSAFGAMLSVVLDTDTKGATNFGRNCRLFKMAGSLGGVESLLSYPTKMSHAGMTEEERLSRGIPPTLVRVSVGIEDPEDLIEDLDRALARL